MVLLRADCAATCSWESPKNPNARTANVIAAAIARSLKFPAVRAMRIYELR